MRLTRSSHAHKTYPDNEQRTVNARACRQSVACIDRATAQLTQHITDVLRCVFFLLLLLLLGRLSFKISFLCLMRPFRECVYVCLSCVRVGLLRAAIALGNRRAFLSVRCVCVDYLWSNNDKIDERARERHTTRGLSGNAF